MTVSATATSVPAGGTVLFLIYAQAGSAEEGTITTALAPSATTPAFSPPVFTAGSCACHPGGGSFELALSARPPAASQVGVEVRVPPTAPAGETIQFSATVSVANGSGPALTATASAAPVTVTRTSASPSASASGASTTGGSTGGASSGGASSGGASSGGASASGASTAGRSTGGGSTGGSGATIPSEAGSAGDLGAALPVGDLTIGALPIGALPVIGSAASGGTVKVPAGSAANLFPQINPSSAPSTTPKTGPGAQSDQDAATTSSVIPISLTGSQFGSQIIGLIMLLLGVAIVVTGISVRKARAIGKPHLQGGA